VESLPEDAAAFTEYAILMFEQEQKRAAGLLILYPYQLSAFNDITMQAFSENQRAYVEKAKLWQATILQDVLSEEFENSKAYLLFETLAKEESRYNASRYFSIFIGSLVKTYYDQTTLFYKSKKPSQEKATTESAYPG